MKKLLLTLTMLALLGFLSACAWLEEPEIDYRAAMIEAAVHAEEAAVREAAELRNAVLDAQGALRVLGQRLAARGALTHSAQDS